MQAVHKQSTAAADTCIPVTTDRAKQVKWREEPKIKKFGDVPPCFLVSEN
jgi:hypothetical protein